MELQRDDTFCRNIGVGFNIIACFDAIDIKLVMITENPDGITIPSIFVKDTMQGLQIAGHQQATAVLIIDIAPMSVTDIRLVSHHVIVYHLGTVLDTAVDKTRRSVAR